jgi:tetratricopeptide (TPR) repeat protein
MNSQQTPRAQLYSLIEIAKEHSEKRKLDAPQKWRAAADLSRSIFGEVHETTIYCQNNVGKALIATRKFAEAIPLLEAALRKARAFHGYAHPSVEHTCQALARAYKARSDFASAHKHWINAAESSETLRGLQHNTTIYCYHQAARCLADQKKFEEALVFFDKVLDATIALHGNCAQTAFVLRDKATCLNQLGRFEDAHPVWSRAFTLFDRNGKRKEATEAFHCMRFTKHRKKAARTAKAMAALANVEGLNDGDRSYIAALNLSTAQLTAVSERLRETYLSSDFENTSDLRIAVKHNRKQVDDYRERAATGCCGSKDIEFEVHEGRDGNKATIMLGFNFGH